MKMNLEQTHRVCASLLRTLIEDVFCPHVQLTLIVKNPHIADGAGDMMFSRDEPDTIIKTVEMLRDRGEAHEEDRGDD